MVEYRAYFENNEGVIQLTRMFNNKKDTSTVTENILQLEDMETLHDWREPGVAQSIGKSLFDLLNGTTQLLDHALKEADDHGEPLQLFVQKKGELPDLPFELLYDSQFLVPYKIHVIYHVSDYGCKRAVTPEDRPLKILFIACSPEKVKPVLDYEKEEETMLEVTRDLPVEIEVEDTGSLQGLCDCLEQGEYDVIHVSGHADIEDGTPVFCMEDEEGFLEKVTPSQLQDVLSDSLKRPRLIFLSGCRTGKAPDAAVSFAHFLVAEHSPTVAGWGLPVSDPGATLAATRLYRELSRGKPLLDAVFSARQVLYKSEFPDWSLLRLFSDGTPLDIPLVKTGQKKPLKARDIQYAYLQNSQVKVLKKGFVGRRRQIQRSIRSLKKDEQKVGLLLHGTGGLGKSCLAGKLCERFKDHALIIVHGKLSDFTFSEAVKDAFIRTGDDGQKILQEQEMPDAIRTLCSTSFQNREYLIVLDDFEKNLEGYEKGTPVVSGKALPILEMLLQYLPLAVKRTQLIITSRYTFPFMVNGRDLIKERLEKIGLTSFRGADEGKKISELQYINQYHDLKIRHKLIEAGRGNPRLMEVLNTLVKEKGVDETLLDEVKGKQEEFVQELILKEILKSQPEAFQKVLQYQSVYRVPVTKEGIKIACEGIEDWESYVERGVQLSLIEEGKERVAYYWVTPLLREEIFEELEEDEKVMCHKAAVIHYQNVLSVHFVPVYAFELIDHALECGMNEAAIEVGGILLPYLRENLLYKEAVYGGMNILSHIPESEFKKDEKSSRFFYEFGWILHDVGDAQKAVEYYEKALKIDRKVYGENHPRVATKLNNLGSAWDALGDSQKAVEYFEKALKIDRKVYGENHPSVATDLNNLGGAWDALGDSQKAVEYFEKALKIDRKVYGENHPRVATKLNNLGLAWDALGDSQKAVEYYEKALSIVINVYGENHPYVAATLNNLGSAWKALGDAQKAVEYYEKALSIVTNVYGERHPNVATMIANLGVTWLSLRDPKKAVECIQKAYNIYQEVYGDHHPDTKAAKKALDTLKNL